MRDNQGAGMTHPFPVSLALLGAALALLLPACATVGHEHGPDQLTSGPSVTLALHPADASPDERPPPADAWRAAGSEACQLAPEFTGSADWQLTPLRDGFGKLWDIGCCDARHYYSKQNLTLLAAGLAVAAPLANTALDQEFRDWYQDEVRADDLDGWSRWAKVPGEHWYAIPVYLAAACGGKWRADTPLGATLHVWGNRTLRAALVGAPTVGILQVGLGASRPGEAGSAWRPFQDNNAVAGHGFMGALPFLTAASMSDNTCLRVPLVAASFATDWSRINDDGHYLSQAILGWWIAYLSVKSVADCDRERFCTFLPCATGGGPGVSVLVRY